jgi:hypothetical protein
LELRIEIEKLKVVAAEKQKPWWQKLTRQIKDFRGHDSSEAMTEIMRGL